MTVTITPDGDQQPNPQDQPDSGGSDGGDDLPDEYRGKSAAEIAKMHQDERERLAAAEQARKNYEQGYQQLLMASLASSAQQPQQQTPRAEEQIPDYEDDPKAHIEAQVARRVAEEVQKQVNPAVTQQQSYNQLFLEQAVQANRESARRSYADYDKYAKEIDEFLRQYAVQDRSVLARPGAFEEAYFRVKGRHAAAEERERSAKDQAALSTQSAPIPGDDGLRPRDTKLNPKETHFATRFQMDDKTFRAMQGAGRMDIDEYRKLKAEREAAANKGRR